MYFQTDEEFAPMPRSRNRRLPYTEIAPMYYSSMPRSRNRGRTDEEIDSVIDRVIDAINAQGHLNQRGRDEKMRLRKRLHVLEEFGEMEDKLAIYTLKEEEISRAMPISWNRRRTDAEIDALIDAVIDAINAERHLKHSGRINKMRLRNRLGVLEKGGVMEDQQAIDVLKAEEISSSVAEKRAMWVIPEYSPPRAQQVYPFYSTETGESWITKSLNLIWDKIPCICQTCLIPSNTR